MKGKMKARGVLVDEWTIAIYRQVKIPGRPFVVKVHNGRAQDAAFAKALARLVEAWMNGSRRKDA